ncbi:polyketide synthase [Apiospora saccharicola]|uniref:Polyketide synthase n=1 Tax=Apiospora saccharicola TaxID=335842 RepID=A0ABR1UN99_9PEZI
MITPANTSTPIAVIGLSCRFAGDATDANKLWELMQKKRSSWSTIPESRFNANGVYHPNGQRLGSVCLLFQPTYRLLEYAADLRQFTRPTWKEDIFATRCRRFRRRVLQHVGRRCEIYESMESAGIPMERAAASNTSVYAGIMFRDYHDSTSRDPETMPRYFMTGNAATMASNRVSHSFDLRGPSMTVDTGCSTTLTTLHLAAQGTRAGECDMSIVTGASLMLNPDVFLTMSNLGFLSPDGSSYAFDHRANGYGRGEGVASLILKPLEDALRDRDPIRAVIRETALNQDGRTATITAPSDEAQARLIRACYQKAGLDPGVTTYVEAHGTGTPVGDPLEISAVASAFGSAKRGRQPLLVGSVKSNIGHTEAASGLASVIKVVLSLEKGLISPNGNMQQPNPNLRLGERNIEIPRELQPWPLLNGVRRASVNNFGFGGRMPTRSWNFTTR